MKPKLIQFNWRRHWSRRVAPYLAYGLVQASLDLGMRQLDENWKRGNPPWLLGRAERNRVIPGKLSWYQPFGCCHYIAFFSMAIGVLNYPCLEWRFISGDLHTVPVGYDADGNPRMVMDILLFARKTAEESIEFAMREVDEAPAAEGWNEAFQAFCDVAVPLLRDTAEAIQQKEEAAA